MAKLRKWRIQYTIDYGRYIGKKTFWTVVHSNSEEDACLRVLQLKGASGIVSCSPLAEKE
jgi:hypothetical protein